MSKFNTTNAKDTGSLHVGTSAGSHQWKKGDVILIKGEKAPRTITFVMGQGDRTHVCAKGTGPMPIGPVEYTIVTPTVNPTDASYETETEPAQA